MGWTCSGGVAPPGWWGARTNLRRFKKAPYLSEPQNRENGVTRERAGLLARARARWKAELDAVSLMPPAWGETVVEKRYEVLKFLNRASRVQKVPRRQIIPSKVLVE